jgi:hypothetical protein
MARYKRSASPLDSVDFAFRALTEGPAPLAVNGRRISNELPQRRIPLDELKRVLLRASASPTVRDAAWAHLVRSARRDGPPWVIGAVGVALPGLRRAAGRVTRGYRGDTADIDAEVLTGFLAALHTVDLARPKIALRLCWAGYRAGARLRYADAAFASRHTEAVASVAPPRPWGHPDLVLADAVAKRVITAGQAELIARTRLEDLELQDAARELRISYAAAKMRRLRAEWRLADAISCGEVGSPLFPGAA